MESPHLVLTITDEFSEDVVAGLKMYRDLTQASASDDEIRANWCRWFCDNPFGRGVFAIAKDRDRLVGFYSLIPSEMQFGNRLVRGGKGEFYAVHPAYRKVKDPVSGMVLPMALLAETKRQAPKFGILAAFGARVNMSFTSLITGAKAIPCNSIDYVMYFCPLRTANNRSTLKRLTLRWGAFLVSSLLQAIFRFRKSRAIRAKHFQMSDTLTGEIHPSSEAVNRPVSLSSKMLNYRFPSDRYLKYTVFQGGGSGGELVFSKPELASNVRLLHWSSLEFSLGIWASIIGDVLQRCYQSKAASLHLSMPKNILPKEQNFAKLGFLRRPKQSVVYISCMDKELEHLRDEHP
jgi:hypothetical protein